MRVIKLSLMTCALAVACAAQSAITIQAPPGVKVYSFDWRTSYRSWRSGSFGTEKPDDFARTDPMSRERLSRSGSLTSSDPRRLEMPDTRARPAGRTPRGYISSIQLKNTGANAIRAVEWEHVFYADRAKQSEQKRFKFRREMSVGPGEQKFVSQSVATDDRSKLATKPRQSVVITLIEYSDG